MNCIFQNARDTEKGRGNVREERTKNLKGDPRIGRKKKWDTKEEEKEELYRRVEKISDIIR